MTHRAFCDALAKESVRNHTHSKKQSPEILTRKKHVPDPESLTGSNPTASSVAPVETRSAKIISPRAINTKRPGN